MEMLTDSEAAALRGGWFMINVAPTVAPTIVITSAIQSNAGASVAIGLLGASATAGLTQASILSLLTSSR